MELYINDILIDLDSRIPFPLNFQINDIKEPQNKKSSTSNTVTLPGTANNVRTMSGVFTVSAVDSVEGGATAFNDFDPTIKATARYYEKGVLQFQGVCQLLDCIKNNGTWSFEVVLFEEVVDIFKLLGNYRLTELGWSEYNHILNITNQANSWTGSIIKDSVAYNNVTGNDWKGEGYYYGLIDYGYDRPSDTIFRVADLAPQVFVKNIVDKMFEKIEVTYDSDFFDTQKFKKLLLAYDGGEFPTVDSTVSAANSVETDQLTDGSGNVVDITQNLIKDSQTPVFLPSILSSEVEYNSDSATNVDPSGLIQSDEPFRFTAQQPGNYQLVYSGTIDIDLDFTPTGGGGAYSIDWFRQASMVIFKNNQPYQAQQIYSETVQTTSLTNNKSITGSFTFDLDLEPSDYIQVAFFYQNEYSFQDNINAATAVSSTLTIAPVTSLDITLQQQQIVEGQLVNIRQFLPDNLTCADFFKGLINMFNLTVRPSETNPRLLEIEPLDDFYFGTQTALGADLTLDWTNKVDHSKECRVTPTVNLASKGYKFSFSDDGDYWNTRYKTDTLEGYGVKELLSSSEFSVGTTEYKLPFSTKPLVQIGDTDLIIPQSFQIKTDVGGLSTKQPKKGKPFIVQLKRANAGTLQTGVWTHRASGGDTARTKYPYVGHLDDIDSPQFDLLFDVPDYVFYDITGGNDYTTNNLYIYHSKFLRELVDRNGKLLTCYINLNASDINTLDFRRLIKIDGVVYRLQKIEGYDSGKYITTKVELLKILEGENVATYTQVPAIDDKYSVGTIGINLDKVPDGKSAKSLGVDSDGNMVKSDNDVGDVLWKIVKISQTGTSAPTYTEVINNTGETITVSRTGVGTFLFSGFDGQLSGNVEIFYNGNQIEAGESVEIFSATGTNNFVLRTFDDTNTLADGVLTPDGVVFFYGSITIKKYA